VSSSGHLALVPQLLGWAYPELPADARKTFEVALHAGSTPALLLAARGELRDDARLLALTVLPPAVAGLALERVVEERLGGACSVGVAQALAGAALVVADLRGGAGSCRPAAALDHLAVGLAQAVALVPGVSRSGAALTAARLRGLSRPAALRLSLRAAVPVTVAAGALKAARRAAGGGALAARSDQLPRDALTAGATAALLSSLWALPLLTLLERAKVLRAVACYRLVLGVAVLSRERRRRPAAGPISTAIDE
jgi:undecaprenyl-diphosphatase